MGVVAIRVFVHALEFAITTADAICIAIAIATLT